MTRIAYYLLTSLVLFTVIAIVYPGYGPSDATSLILELTGALYLMLAGFFIYALWSRYKDMRDSVATETGYLIEAVHLAKALGEPKFLEELIERTDRYLVATMNFELDAIGKVDTAYYKLLDVLSLSKKKDTNVFDRILDCFDYVTAARVNESILGTSGLGMSKKAVMYALAAVLILTLIYSKTTTFQSMLMTVFMPTAIMVVLSLIDELDTFQWSDSSINFEPYEAVFDIIGKPRYYHEEDIQSGRVRPPQGSNYRLGNDESLKRMRLL